MYNNIPSERTSKRAIFIMLLCCVTLVSVLAAGYFAWIAKDMQTRFAQFETLEELENSKDEIQAILPVENEEVVIPVFTYPEAVQVPYAESYEGESSLVNTLHDWELANKDTGYCENVGEYRTSEKVNQYGTTVQQALTDDGIRAALIAYFQVTPELEETFFAGIESVIDEDDRFALGYTMCSAGSRRFLLLEDLHGVIQPDGTEDFQAFPEILAWENFATPYWTLYPVSEYRAMDGYGFIPNWNGLAVLMTGYGDAGYAHWEYQLLQDAPGEHVLVLMEKCTVEPPEDRDEWSSSITTCEVRYSE